MIIKNPHPALITLLMLLATPCIAQAKKKAPPVEQTENAVTQITAIQETLEKYRVQLHKSFLQERKDEIETWLEDIIDYLEKLKLGHKKLFFKANIFIDFLTQSPEEKKAKFLTEKSTGLGWALGTEETTLAKRSILRFTEKAENPTLIYYPCDEKGNTSLSTLAIIFERKAPAKKSSTRPAPALASVTTFSMAAIRVRWCPELEMTEYVDTIHPWGGIESSKISYALTPPQTRIPAPESPRLFIKSNDQSYKQVKSFMKYKMKEYGKRMSSFFWSALGY